MMAVTQSGLISTAGMTLGQVGAKLVPAEWGEPVRPGPRNSSNSTSAHAQAISIYRIALPIIFGVIICLGIIGNVMVTVVIATRRKMYTVTNFLLFNLAIADVAFLVICGPFAMAQHALDSWLLGNTMCQVIQYFLYVTCYVTVYTLVAVAVVRYFLMVRLSTHPCVKNPRYIVFIIIAIWSASLVINIPVPLTHGVTPSIVDNTTECVIIGTTARGQLFYSLFFTFAYALPILSVATLYLLIVVHLRQSHKRSMVNKSGNGNSSKSGSDRRSHVTRLLVLVVTVFAICWLPVHVHLLWAIFGDLPDSIVYRTLVIIWYALIFLNSALNPLIYHVFSTEFRESFKKLFARKPNDETSSSGATSSRDMMKTSAS